MYATVCRYCLRNNSWPWPKHWLCCCPTGGETHVDMSTKSKKKFTKNTFCFNICAHSKQRNWLNGPIWKNIASSYLAAFVVCGGIIIYNTSAPWILILTNSHQNTALILESVCKFKYDIILGVISFPWRQASRVTFLLPACVQRRRKPFSLLSLMNSRRPNFKQPDKSELWYEYKWGATSILARRAANETERVGAEGFLNSNRSVNICFRPPSLVSAVTPTEFLDAAEQQRREQMRRPASQLLHVTAVLWSPLGFAFRSVDIRLASGACKSTLRVPAVDVL